MTPEFRDPNKPSGNVAGLHPACEDLAIDVVDSLLVNPAIPVNCAGFKVEKKRGFVFC